MSMLDAIGGLSGGLGGSGGVGGSIPSNSSAANSAANATVNPNTTVSGIGGGGNSWGPFSVNFPGTQSLPLNAINAPPITSSVFASPVMLIGGVILLLAIVFLYR